MLTNKEILQIDATVLAGLLILLTIISLEPSDKIVSVWTSPNSWALWVGLGFSFSAILSICASVINEKKHPIGEKNVRLASMAFMLTGFIFLGIIFFVVGEYQSLTNTGIINATS